MSRILYHANLDQFVFASDVIRMLLERSTSSYSPNPDHDFLDDFTGGSGVEISVASYARQTLGTKVRTVDNTNNWIKYSSANVSFGSLEVGQTVKAIILCKQVGGDDATPADDPILLYDDGKIDVVLAANAAMGATTIYVEPLDGAIPSGASLDFGGGATGTTSGVTAAGARSITLSGGGLGAAATAGAIDTEVATSSILPAALQGGIFEVACPTNGWFRRRQKGR
jgi:hypothetical protein